MKTSRRDDQIEALHAALLALLAAGVMGAPVPPTTWVFTSQTAGGEWLFTYMEQENSPGEGWKKISEERMATVSGGVGFVRVGVGAAVEPARPPYSPPKPIGRTGLAEASKGGSLKVKP